MSVDVAELENELAALRHMLDTTGWKIHHDNWSKLLAQCAQTLRSPDCENRDWYAGLVTGYERLLCHPRNRILDIEKKLQELDKLKRIAT